MHRTLHDAGGRVDTVYFLEDGICSMVVTMSSGATVEVGRIGRDGFVGAGRDIGHGPHAEPMLHGDSRTGYSIKAKILQEHSEASPSCAVWLLRSVHCC